MLLPSAALSQEAIPQPVDHREVFIKAVEGCEDPSGDPNIRILDTNNKYSYGVLQFQMGTWLSYGKPFGSTTENIHDPVLQEKVARSILDKGGWRNWYTCAKRAASNVGDY